MTDEPSRRPAHAPPRPINAYAIFLKTSYTWTRKRLGAAALAQNQQHAEPRPGERVVLWCLYDPDANEAKPWRVQWKEGGEKMGTRKGRDDVRVKA